MAGIIPEGVQRASTQLWDQFEALNQKLAQDVLSKRAALDEEYANKLQAFGKDIMGQAFLGGALSSWFSSAPKDPPISREGALLRKALERPQQVAIDQSQFLLEFVSKIRNEIVKPLTNFLNAKEARRKEIAPDAQRWLKTWQEAKEDVATKRASFLKAMQAVDAAGEAFEKEEQRMGYRDEKTFKAAEQRLEQAQEKGKAAEKEYLDAVNLANGLARDVFQNHLPPMLDELQIIEFQRQGTLLGALNVLSSLQEAYAPFLQDKYAEMSLIIKKECSAEKDWNEWVSTVASKSSEAETIEFEPYVSRYTSTQTQWNRPPPVQPGRPLKGVVGTVMGEDDPIIPLGAGTSPAFEDEIIDPFTYGRAPAISEPPRYAPDSSSFATTSGMMAMRSGSPQRIGTSPPVVSAVPPASVVSAVSAVVAASGRKPSPQRVPSTPPTTVTPLAPVVSNSPPAAVVALKAAPVPVSVTKPVPKTSAAVNSILGAAIAAQKPVAVPAMRDRSSTTATTTTTTPLSTAVVVPLSPRGGGGASTASVSPRNASATITVAPRIVPLGNPIPTSNAAPAPLSPRGRGATVTANPSWERKAPARPASERKEM